MPRGSETQEPKEESQEERDISQETPEVKEESQRLEQAAVESEAVVERERDTSQSEEIEKELVQAVEAVDAAGTETGSEISATPITLPGQAREGEEVSATPINTPGGIDQVALIPENDGVSEIEQGSADLDGKGEGRTVVEAVPSPEWDDDPPRPPQGTIEDRADQAAAAEEVSATPITLPYEDPDGIKDPVEADQAVRTAGQQPGDDVAATPINLPNIAEEPDHGPNPIEDTAQAEMIEDQKQTPTRPIMEKELPEGGQQQEGLDQREDLQDLMDKDLDSLMPDGGEIIGADGKKVGGSKFGNELIGMPGMDSGGKIDFSAEDPSGDQFAGKSMFKPGKGPGGGDMKSDVPGANPSSTWTNDERDAYVSGKAGVQDDDSAGKEKNLQEEALDDYEITQVILSEDEEEEEKLRKQYGGSKSETSGLESTPEEEGGSDGKAVTQAELDAVLEETSGDQISIKDPDGQGEGVPDGHLKLEAAKKVKDAMDQVASIKHKQKKAGAEVVTDPDQEDQDGKAGGTLGKKLGL